MRKVGYIEKNGKSAETLRYSFSVGKRCRRLVEISLCNVKFHQLMGICKKINWGRYRYHSVFWCRRSKSCPHLDLKRYIKKYIHYLILNRWFLFCRRLAYIHWQLGCLSFWRKSCQANRRFWLFSPVWILIAEGDLNVDGFVLSRE